ncbi:MAG: ATP-dependent Clp protease proteolytic subunit [Candidatus Hydrogenedentota bacterium]|nr:MAG: ATP-dependent Clp protease proteolytic subunit [Candidatus Hydrogenedentota bacterium]
MLEYRNEDKKEDEKKEEGGFGALMLKARTVLVNGQVDDELAQKVIPQIIALDEDSHDPIKVIVTTPGGHVDSGFAIQDILKFVESPIITIGAGWVASIGVPIFMGAPKGQRYSLPSTRFLIHQPSGGAGGQVSDIRIEAQEILKIREKINKMIAEETGQTVEKISKDSERNFWMSAEEALSYGLVDKIISSSTEIK